VLPSQLLGEGRKGESSAAGNSNFVQQKIITKEGSREIRGLRIILQKGKRGVASLGPGRRKV